MYLPKATGAKFPFTIVSVSYFLLQEKNITMHSKPIGNLENNFMELKFEKIIYVQIQLTQRTLN